MNTPTSVEFRIGELRTIKMKARSGDNPGHADLTIRVGLGEDFEVASPFLAHLQDTGKPITLSVSEVQMQLPINGGRRVDQTTGEIS